MAELDMLDRTIHVLEICDCHLGVCPLNSVPDCTFQARLDALELLREMRAMLHPAPPRVLSYEEIMACPDGSVLWQETLIDWRKSDYEPCSGNQIDIDIAPVEKRGDMLIGSGMDTALVPFDHLDLFGDHDKGCYTRYWNARPSEEHRKWEAWNG